MAEEPAFPSIISIFYAEFLPIQGSKVLYDTPEGFATTENSIEFDSISEYIIPKPALCNRLVTISTQHHKIMSYPILISNPKYERNALIFNLCFVFDKVDTFCYDQIVMKAGRVLLNLELESEYLSQKKSLMNIIAQIKSDLNSYHECQIVVNDVNTLDLKLFIQFKDKGQVADFQVPIFICDVSLLVNKYWDLTMLKVIKFVNGVNSVTMIARLAEVDISYVRLAVQHLIYYGCVKFNNLYTTSYELSRLLKATDIQKECLEFISKKGFCVTLLYCQFKGSITLLDIIKENPLLTSRIDIRRFIVFGVLRKILKRVHRYPILLGESGSIPQPLSMSLNGKNHMDSLCTKFHYGSRELLELLNGYPSVQIICKCDETKD